MAYILVIMKKKPLHLQTIHPQHSDLTGSGSLLIFCTVPTKMSELLADFEL